MKTSRTKYSKSYKNYLKLMELYKCDERYISDRFSKYGWTVENITSFKGLQNFALHGYENIFIETAELFDFLSQTKVVSNGDIPAQIFQALTGKNYNVIEDKDIIVRCYNFMLYAPIDKINTALAVSFRTTEKKWYLKDGVNVIENSLIWTNKFATNYITLDKKEFNTNTIPLWSNKDFEEFSVIVNTLFYMNAFPDCVVDGVPKRAIIDEGCFTNKRTTLSPNKKFFEKITKSPHLRRGHFRTYTNDFYKNMKGKTVWIEPVFVKGKAITVIDGVSA